MKIKAKDLKPGQVFWLREEEWNTQDETYTYTAYRIGITRFEALRKGCVQGMEFPLDPERSVWIIDDYGGAIKEMLPGDVVRVVEPKEESAKREDSQDNHMLKHRVKVKDVPVGMTFYTSYEDWNIPEEINERVRLADNRIQYVSIGEESEKPLTPEQLEQWVWVSKPELCVSKVEVFSYKDAVMQVEIPQHILDTHNDQVERGLVDAPKVVMEHKHEIPEMLTIATDREGHKLIAIDWRIEPVLQMIDPDGKVTGQMRLRLQDEAALLAWLMVRNNGEKT